MVSPIIRTQPILGALTRRNDATRRTLELAGRSGRSADRLTVVALQGRGGDFRFATRPCVALLGVIKRLLRSEPTGGHGAIYSGEFTFMRLRRFAILAAVMVAAPLITIAGQGAAEANTTCNVWGPHDAGLYTRNCVIESSRIGGTVQGSVYWDYKQSSGRGDNGSAILQINDRTADGKCTFFKIKYRGSDPAQTVVRQACGGNQNGPTSFGLNSSFDEGGGWGLHADGYYSIEHCSGDSCIEVWRQKVGQAPPS